MYRLLRPDKVKVLPEENKATRIPDHWQKLLMRFWKQLKWIRKMLTTLTMATENATEKAC